MQCIAHDVTLFKYYFDNMVVPTSVFSVIVVLLWLLHQCCLSVWRACILRPLIDFTYRQQVKNYKNMQSERKLPVFNEQTGTIRMINIWINYCLLEVKNNKDILAINIQWKSGRINTWHTLPLRQNSFEWHKCCLSHQGIGLISDQWGPFPLVVEHRLYILLWNHCGQRPFWKVIHRENLSVHLLVCFVQWRLGG